MDKLHAGVHPDGSLTFSQLCRILMTYCVFSKEEILLCELGGSQTGNPNGELYMFLSVVILHTVSRPLVEYFGIKFSMRFLLLSSLSGESFV